MTLIDSGSDLEEDPDEEEDKEYNPYGVEGD